MFLTTAGDFIDQLMESYYKLLSFELSHDEGGHSVRGDLLQALLLSLHLLRFVVKQSLLLSRLVNTIVDN